jgi:hypothetical protein
MTFSLLRRVAGTRGLDAVIQRCRSECFLLRCVGTEPSRARRGAPPPNHFGTRGPKRDTIAEHNTHVGGVFPFRSAPLG